MRPDRSIVPKRIRHKPTLDKLLTELTEASEATDQLKAWKRLSANSHAVLIELVAKARKQGTSWSDIADALGVSKQAVIQRFGRGGTYDVEARNRRRD